MSLLLIDGFDHYATGDITEKWNTKEGTCAISAGNGRRSSDALLITSQMEYVSFSTSERSTFIVGLAIKVTENPSSFATNLIAFRYVGYTQVVLLLETDLSLSVARGSSSRLATSTSGLQLGVWHYVEFKATIDNTSGSYTVRVDGTVVLSGTGADTQYSSSSSVANSIAIGQSYAGFVEFYIDDVYILNTDGSPNDFLGDCRVDYLLPGANGATNDFTASAGSNYQCVDDADPDDDSTYVSSSTVGHVDLYAFGDISHTPDTIHGVQVLMSAKADDAGDRSIAEVCRSGGTNYSGTSQTLGTDYRYFRQILTTDPDTGSAWGKTGLNAAQFGVEIAA